MSGWSPSSFGYPTPEEVSDYWRRHALWQTRSIDQKRTEAQAQALARLPGRDPNAPFMDALAAAYMDLEYEEYRRAEITVRSRSLIGVAGQWVLKAQQAIESAAWKVQHYEFELKQARQADREWYDWQRTHPESSVARPVYPTTSVAYPAEPEEPDAAGIITASAAGGVLDRRTASELVDAIAAGNIRALFTIVQRNPRMIRDAIEFARQMRTATVVLTTSGGSTDTRFIVTSDERTIIPLPVKFNVPIADSVATVASASTTLNLTFGAFRSIGQLPS